MQFDVVTDSFLWLVSKWYYYQEHEVYHRLYIRTHSILLRNTLLRGCTLSRRKYKWSTLKSIFRKHFHKKNTWLSCCWFWTRIWLFWLDGRDWTFSTDLPKSFLPVGARSQTVVKSNHHNWRNVVDLFKGFKN